MAADANVVELLLRLVVSMGLIVGIIVVAAKFMKGRSSLNFGGRKGDGPTLDVLDRTQVARHASVAVVRVGGRGLVVGITESSVTLLSEAPELVDRYEQAEAGRLARSPWRRGTEASPMAELIELQGTEAGGLGDNNSFGEIELQGTEAGGLGDNNSFGEIQLRGTEAGGLGATERERTALGEPEAPGRTRMNFFEALRESTVRRS